MPFYPKISEDTVLTFTVVEKSIKQDPAYLDHPECPYPERVKDYFRNRSGAGVEVEDLFPEGEEKELVLDRQVELLINDLEAFSKQLSNADHSEKLQYFKTKSALLEKLVTMRERIHNLKEMSEFRNTIMAFLDEVCTPDQITELMQRLDNL